MPKRKPAQPELIREERADYKITPEDQARKDEYRARLRTFLEDPESRKIEGFPIGEIDDILALSDPPYYTACPNPFLAEIIQQWNAEREASQKSKIENRKYHREPFAADVSEGKNDPIYNAHSYHTKVPHKAIMRYILHYTEPGDVVFDGFCGTGMTGVAAQLCGDKKTVESMGYRVTDDGAIYEGDKLVSQLGARKAVLNDLSPAATFIAYNYNTPVDVTAFDFEAKRILDEIKEECGWMYQTMHKDGKTMGRINYTIWSEVFICPNCGNEMVFWESAVDPETGYRTEKEKPIVCSGCGAANPLIKWEIGTIKYFDPIIGKTLTSVKRIPVQINYSIGKTKYDKKPDPVDFEILEKIEKETIEYWYPTTPMLLKGDKWGDTWRAGIHLGLTHTHHFYTKRNLYSWAMLIEKVNQSPENLRRKLHFWLESVAYGHTLLNRYLAASYSQVNRYLKGTMYIAPFISEASPWFSLNGKVKSVQNANIGNLKQVSVTTGSSTQAMLKDDSIDYIFIDPPFGSNIMYSDLNFIWEAWLKVITNSRQEAIINKTQDKSLNEFKDLMQICFREFKRILKPGRWMTVEFHNSSNTVWAAIQETITQAGFVIADVRTLDKQQETMQQMVSAGAVKQDLVITAYKPNDNLEERFQLEAGTTDGAWDFIRYHLSQLPRVVEKNGEIEVAAERQDYLLFDRMVAFHIQRGASVPLSAGEFYAGLKQKFVERDGMYFLPDQVAEYDSARMRLGRVAQLALFVSDEKSAIQWLRQQLTPELGGELQTFAELQPKFMQIARSIAKHEQMPDLGEILEQNFLEDASGKWYSPDPSKATDLERLRLKSLLREFNEYVQAKGKLKQFRTEAVRAGFAEAYKKREYKIILEVAARLPESVLHEDPDLLMYFDTATLRAEE